MKKEDAKIGTCVVCNQDSEFIEGIIVKNISKFSVEVMWYQERSGLHSFIAQDCVAEVLDINPVPHFIRMNNLYKIVSKLSKDKDLHFLGESILRGRYYIAYFKAGNIFFQISGYWTNDSSKKAYVYLKEAENIDDLYWPQEVELDFDKYYLYKNYMVPITIADINKLNTVEFCEVMNIGPDEQPEKPKANGIALKNDNDFVYGIFNSNSIRTCRFFKSMDNMFELSYRDYMCNKLKAHFSD